MTWWRSLQAHGHVARGYLGVQIQSVTPEIAASLGLKDAKGAIVAEVVPGGPAAKAGFQQGDIVTRRSTARRCEDSRDLTRRVAALPAGTKRRPSPIDAPGQAEDAQGRDRRRARTSKVASNDAGKRSGRAGSHRPRPWAWAWRR